MSVAMAAEVQTRRVALIGNPNSGKSTVFNALTGLKQRVGNYPGVTVEKKTGAMGAGIELIDLPGTYSLAAHSPDELLVSQLLLGQGPGEPRPDLVVVIVDANNLQRNLYLLTQILELGLPVVVALNMIDLAEKAGKQIDAPGLAKALGVPVVPTVATGSRGLEGLRCAIEKGLGAEQPAPVPLWSLPEPLGQEIGKLCAVLPEQPFLVGRALIDEEGYTERAFVERHGGTARRLLLEARARVRQSGRSPASLEAHARYGWIARALDQNLRRRAEVPRSTPSDRLDALLTHRLLGSLIFVALMSGVFMLIFECAAPFMELIDRAFGALGELVGGLFAGSLLEGGMFQSLLVDGVVAGLGGVLVFLPQICFLFFFLALLEDCGYMARAAFLMDRLLRFAGLSGHSFIPMMSSFACAVPGVMATRTISNTRERLATILVAPLMSCSARIPVYAMMIVAFVPAVTVGRFFQLQGLAFAAMYFLGIVVAIPVALLLKLTLLKGPPAPFVMELPAYKIPAIRNVFLRVWEAVKAFVSNAGTIILAITIVIWALNFFPHDPAISQEYAERRSQAEQRLSGEGLEERLAELDRLEAGEHQRNSLFGRMGRFIEPLVRPLGWDWRLGMAALASFPAREVIISTLGITFNLGQDLDGEEGQKLLIEKMSAAKWPDGRPVLTLPVALSVMVFFALCCQCGATIATIRRETNSWKWPAITFGYMTVLGYLGAFLAYRIGTAFLG